MAPTHAQRSVRRQRALTLIERVSADEAQGVADVLGRLCRAVTQDLDLSGATVTLIPAVGSHSVAAASSTSARRTEELQFDAGEGPTRDAYACGRPVIVTDLGSVAGRWPGYVPAALAAGVEAVFALPLQVGATRLGALTLYWPRPRRPATRDLRTALVFGELATDLVIDRSYSPETDGLDRHLRAALDTHGHIYQAQGMVMVDLEVALPEALARMRAHAYATDQDLAALAQDIILGATLTQDPR